jgi:hypothetical protein
MYRPASPGFQESGGNMRHDQEIKTLKDINEFEDELGHNIEDMRPDRRKTERGHTQIGGSLRDLAGMSIATHPPGLALISKILMIDIDRRYR